jgi:hypothetical protein
MGHNYRITLNYLKNFKFLNRTCDCFEERWQHCEKRILLGHVRPSVCPSAWNNSVPNGWILMKFDISAYFENLSRNLRYIKI